MGRMQQKRLEGNSHSSQKTTANLFSRRAWKESQVLSHKEILDKKEINKKSIFYNFMELSANKIE